MIEGETSLEACKVFGFLGIVLDGGGGAAGCLVWISGVCGEGSWEGIAFVFWVEDLLVEVVGRGWALWVGGL